LIILRITRINTDKIINPNYDLDHELNELTQIKTIKSIELDLDENSFRGLFVILLIYFWVHSRDSWFDVLFGLNALAG